MGACKSLLCKGGGFAGVDDSFGDNGPFTQDIQSQINELYGTTKSAETFNSRDDPLRESSKRLSLFDDTGDKRLDERNENQHSFAVDFDAQQSPPTGLQSPSKFAATTPVGRLLKAAVMQPVGGKKESSASDLPSLAPFGNLFHLGKSSHHGSAAHEPQLAEGQGVDVTGPAARPSGIIPRKSVFSNVVLDDKNDISFDQPAENRPDYARESVFDQGTSIYQNNMSIYDNKASVYDNNMSIYDNTTSRQSTYQNPNTNSMNSMTSMFQNPRRMQRQRRNLFSSNNLFQMNMSGHRENFMAGNQILEEDEEEYSRQEDSATASIANNIFQMDASSQVENLFNGIGHDTHLSMTDSGSHSLSQQSHSVLEQQSVFEQSVAAPSLAGPSLAESPPLRDPSLREPSIRDPSNRTPFMQEFKIETAIPESSIRSMRSKISNFSRRSQSQRSHRSFSQRSKRSIALEMGSSARLSYVSGNSSYSMESVSFAEESHKNDSMSFAEESRTNERDDFFQEPKSPFHRPIRKASSFVKSLTQPLKDAAALYENTYEPPGSHLLFSWTPPPTHHFSSLSQWEEPGSKTGTRRHQNDAIDQKHFKKKRRNRGPMIDLNNEDLWPGFDETTALTSLFGPQDPDSNIDFAAFTGSFAVDDITSVFPDTTPSATFDSFIDEGSEGSEGSEGDSDEELSQAEPENVDYHDLPAEDSKKHRHKEKKRSRKSKKKRRKDESGRRKSVSRSSTSKRRSKTDRRLGRTVSEYSEASEIIPEDAPSVTLQEIAEARRASQNKSDSVAKIKAEMKEVTDSHHGSGLSVSLKEIADAREALTIQSGSIASLKEEMKMLSSSHHKSLSDSQPMLTEENESAGKQKRYDIKHEKKHTAKTKKSSSSETKKKDKKRSRRSKSEYSDMDKGKTHSKENEGSSSSKKIKKRTRRSKVSADIQEGTELVLSHSSALPSIKEETDVPKKSKKKSISKSSSKDSGDKKKSSKQKKKSSGKDGKKRSKSGEKKTSSKSSKPVKIELVGDEQVTATTATTATTSGDHFDQPRREMKAGMGPFDETAPFDEILTS